MILQRTVALLAVLLLATATLPLRAQPLVADPAAGAAPPPAGPGMPAPAPWVQIEVIVFRHLDTSSAGNERWPENPVLSYPEPLRLLDDPAAAASAAATPAASDPGASSPTEPVAFRLLDASQQLLVDAAARIGGSPNYRLLRHLAWRQPAPAGSVTHLLVTGGAQHGEHHELEGSLTIGGSDAVEATIALWLNEFAQAPAADGTPPTGVVLPAVPLTSAPHTAPADASLAFAPLEPAITIEPARAARSVTLNGSRRLAPGELHYLDHPLFGVLLSATPFDPAAQGAAPVEPAPAAPESAGGG